MKPYKRQALLALILWLFDCTLVHGKNHEATYFNVQRSIFGVVDYFKRNEADIRNPDAVVLIDQVQEIYEVDFNYSFSPESDFMIGFNSAFRRLHDNSFRVEKTVFDNIASGHSFNANSIRSLYCDQFPLPNDYLETLSAQIENGGYFATHAGFQLQIAINNGCLDPSNPSVDAVKQKLIVALQQVSNTDTVNVDICIEAMAVLTYLGRSDLLKKEWIRYILSLQNRDGGFPPTAKDVASHPHTAGLALWVLLEVAFNDSLGHVLESQNLDPDASIVEKLSEKLNPVLLAANWYVGKEFQVHWATNFVEAVFSSRSDIKNNNLFLRMYIGLFAPAYQIPKNELIQFSKRSSILNKSLLSLSGLYCTSMSDLDGTIAPILEKAITSDNDWLMDFLLFKGFANDNGCNIEERNPRIAGLTNSICQSSMISKNVGLGYLFESEALRWYVCDTYEPSNEILEAAKSKLATLEYGLSPQDDDRVPIYSFWVSKLSDGQMKRSKWTGY